MDGRLCIVDEREYVVLMILGWPVESGFEPAKESKRRTKKCCLGLLGRCFVGSACEVGCFCEM